MQAEDSKEVDYYKYAVKLRMPARSLEELMLVNDPLLRTGMTVEAFVDRYDGYPESILIVMCRILQDWSLRLVHTQANSLVILQVIYADRLLVFGL